MSRSTKVEKIIVIGGKGTAINIAEHIVDARENYGANVELLGFAIDDPDLGTAINDTPILCKTRDLKDNYNHEDVKFIFSLYRPDRMRERVELLESYGIGPQRFAKFIHPSAYVARSASIGTGTVVLSHTVINSNVVLGNFNIINSGIVVEHDSHICNNNFIAASSCIGANVHINNGVFVGLNTSIRENVTIGDYAFIGMGSNVLNDISSGSVAYGNPAKN